MENTLWVSIPIIQNIVMGTGCDPGEIDLICRAGGITRAVGRFRRQTIIAAKLRHYGGYAEYLGQ